MKSTMTSSCWSTALPFLSKTGWNTHFCAARIKGASNLDPNHVPVCTWSTVPFLRIVNFTNALLPPQAPGWWGSKNTGSGHDRHRSPRPPNANGGPVIWIVTPLAGLDFGGIVVELADSVHTKSASRVHMRPDATAHLYVVEPQLLRGGKTPVGGIPVRGSAQTPSRSKHPWVLQGPRSTGIRGRFVQDSPSGE